MTADTSNVAEHTLGGNGTRSGWQAELSYLADQAERPVYHTSDASRSRLKIEPHTMLIMDARQEGSLSFFGDGFSLHSHDIGASDLRDPAVRDGEYLVSLQEFVKAELGASKVISDTSVLRLPDPDSLHIPILRVHCDYTPGSARQLLEECWDQELSREQGLSATAALIAQSLDGEPAQRRYSRVIALNAWRVISSPPHDYPLAVCARDSVDSSDVKRADLLEEMPDGGTYEGELSLCTYNDRHRWYSYSGMTPDELLLFMGFDFSDPDRCGVMHSAFKDPSCPSQPPGRASVEVRLFAFFE